MVSELISVTKRGDDGNVAFCLGLERTLVVIVVDVYPHRVQMAVGVIDAPVPDAFVAVLGAVMYVHADVKTVVSGCADVVRLVEEEVLLTAVAQVGVVDLLCGHGEAVATVVEPFGIEVCALAKSVAHRGVDLMPVVELVVEPFGVVILELPLVP